MELLKRFLEENKKSCSVEWTNFDFSNEYKNIKALYITHDSYKVFSFIGYPETPMPKGGYPAVVLVHGGNGYAYYEWIKKWTDKGFVAIAPDFDSNYAINMEERKVGNPCGGPKGYGSFSQLDDKTPWTFFSVLSIIYATDVLCEQSVVNANKISLCGLSWGGVLSLIALGIENRFRAGVIFYSSGYLLESKVFDSIATKHNLTERQRKLYADEFDPKSFLDNISVPVLFVAGADDIVFTMSERKKTTQKIVSQKRFSYRKNFAHGHLPGRESQEATDFVMQVLNDNLSPAIEIEKIEDKIILNGIKNFESAQLVYTDSAFDKVREEWESLTIIGHSSVLPKNCKYYFISVIDEEGKIYSSDVYKI